MSLFLFRFLQKKRNKNLKKRNRKTLYLRSFSRQCTIVPFFLRKFIIKYLLENYYYKYGTSYKYSNNKALKVLQTKIYKEQREQKNFEFQKIRHTCALPIPSSYGKSEGMGNKFGNSMEQASLFLLYKVYRYLTISNK